MPSYYAPLLPPPRYMSLMEYRNTQRHLTDRHRVYLVRLTHPTANACPLYDGFDRKALAAALADLEARNPMAARAAYVEECQRLGKRPEDWGVHRQKQASTPHQYLNHPRTPF